MRVRVELKICTRESKSRCSKLEKAGKISLLNSEISIFFKLTTGKSCFENSLLRKVKVNANSFVV